MDFGARGRRHDVCKGEEEQLGFLMRVCDRYLAVRFCGVFIWQREVGGGSWKVVAA